MTIDVTAEMAAAHKALERALSAGQNRPDRLPGLQMIFGQLPRVMTEEIGNLSSLPLKIRLLDLTASTLGESCDLPSNALAGVVRAERWRSWLYFIADAMATTLFVDAASGCEGFSPRGPTVRKPTKTDVNVVRILFRRIARSLTGAFSLLVDIPFEVTNVVDKIELEPQLSKTSPVIVARLTIDYSGHAGIVTIIIPQMALDPVRDLLADATTADAMGNTGLPLRPGNDSGWSKQLADEIARAFIDLSGILEERPIPLGEVQKFAVGTVVELSSSSMSRVRLDSDEVPLFWCELGKTDGALTLRVEDEFDHSKDAVDEFYGL